MEASEPGQPTSAACQRRVLPLLIPQRRKEEVKGNNPTSPPFVFRKEKIVSNERFRKESAEKKASDGINIIQSKWGEGLK